MSAIVAFAARALTRIACAMSGHTWRLHSSYDEMYRACDRCAVTTFY